MPVVYFYQFAIPGESIRRVAHVGLPSYIRDLDRILEHELYPNLEIDFRVWVKDVADPDPLARCVDSPPTEATQVYSSVAEVRAHREWCRILVATVDGVVGVVGDSDGFHDALIADLAVMSPLSRDRLSEFVARVLKSPIRSPSPSSSSRSDRFGPGTARSPASPGKKGKRK